MTGGQGGQDAARSVHSSDREGPPGRPDLEAQGPRETRSREDAQSHPRQRPRSDLSHEAGGSGSGRACPLRRRSSRPPARPQPDPSRGPRPAEAEEPRAVLRARHPLHPKHTPGSRPRGVVHAHGRGGAGAAVTHPGNGTPDSGTAAQTEKVSAAASHQPPNSRLCACVAAIAELPSLPSFKPPANGAAEPREPASSRLLRGPPGRPRRKARSLHTRTRRLSISPVISHTGGGSRVLPHVSQRAHFADREQRSGKGNTFTQSHEGDVSL